MSTSKLLRALLGVVVLCLLDSTSLSQMMPGGEEQSYVVTAGIPDEFRWALFVRDERACDPSDVSAGEKGKIARYLFCPVRPGDRLLHGDYLVDERFLLRVPDKEGTIVAKYPSQVIFRQAVKREPFTDENIPIAVVVAGRTKTTWVSSVFEDEAKTVIDLTDRARKKARLSSH